MPKVQYYLGKQPLYTQDDLDREVAKASNELRVSMIDALREINRLGERCHTLASENERLRAENAELRKPCYCCAGDSVTSWNAGCNDGCRCNERQAA